jgi:protein arginine kinase
MTVETMRDKVPEWTRRCDHDADVVIFSQCSLSRNLADFPFPVRCHEDELRMIEDRVVSTLDNLNLLASGTYHHLKDLSATEQRLLWERRLVSEELVLAQGPRGVYISEDQGMALMVNGLDHVHIRVMTGGQELNELWNRVNLLDDTLGGALDFAFSDRLGYLTALLENVGTALKVRLLLHLPGLSGTDGLAPFVDAATRQRLLLCKVRAGNLPVAASDGVATHRLQSARRATKAGLDQSLFLRADSGLYGQRSDSLGDLYLLTSQGTLGESEEEILFSVRHVASEIVQAERAARDALFGDSRRTLRDRVGRALGVAGGAYYLDFEEAVGLLGTIRMGIVGDVVSDHSLAEYNRLLLQAQRGHLESGQGSPGDAMTLNAARADLFRGRFG